MRLTVFVVNHDADEHVIRLLESLARSRQASATSVSVHVFDNSPRSAARLAAFRAAVARVNIPTTVHWDGRNEGYLGPLTRAQALVSAETQCVIYTNPDITFQEDFIPVLEQVRGSGGILAPSVVAARERLEQNPLYRRRLTRSKLQLLRVVCSSALAFALYAAASRAKERARVWGRPFGAPPKPGEIYAAHGSVLVFTDVDFFRSLPAYPCFLFGEELFVAEEARRAGISIVYEPRLRVLDSRHASVSALTVAQRRAYHLESVSFILARYYGDGTPPAA